MAHEIESDFVYDYGNESQHCRHCTSYHETNGSGFCSEAQAEVAPTSHCDFFQSRN
jgi:hypothetical protein